MGIPAGTKMVKSVEDADYLRSARYRNFYLVALYCMESHCHAVAG